MLYQLSYTPSGEATSKAKAAEVQEFRWRRIGPACLPPPPPKLGVIPAQAGIHPEASPQPATLWPIIKMDPGLRRG